MSKQKAVACVLIFRIERISGYGLKLGCGMYVYGFAGFPVCCRLLLGVFGISG